MTELIGASNITKVNEEQALKIIRKRKPTGLFYHEETHGGKTIFIGLDNSTGDCWVEEFETKKDCINWLDGDEENLEQELEEKYIVTVTETLEKAIHVSASTQEEAMEIVRKRYDNEEIVLSYEDFNDVELKVEKKG